MSKTRNRWMFYDKIENAPRFSWRRALVRADRTKYTPREVVWQP
jgi:hypothetical protein